jgi:hypothetical protein
MENVDVNKAVLRSTLKKLRAFAPKTQASRLVKMAGSESNEPYMIVFMFLACESARGQRRERAVGFLEFISEHRCRAEQDLERVQLAPSVEEQNPCFAIKSVDASRM